MLHYFIINPKAGYADATASITAEIEAVFAHSAETYRIYLTVGTAEDDAFIRGICAQSGEVRFYACGGDGTIHQVVNAIYGYPNASLSVVPCGTGNDYIKCIGGYDLQTLLLQGQEVVAIACG